MKIDLDLSEIDELAKDISVMRKVGFRYAARDTLNTAAFNQREKMQAQMRKDFILRNKHSTRGIRVTKSPNINFLQAEVGSIDPYMGQQETGYTNMARGKHGIVIQTSYSAGLSEKARPRTKLAKPSNRVKGPGGRGRVKLTNTSRKGRSKKQKNTAVVMNALKTGNKYVYMELSRGNRKGIFKVVGGKRKPKVKMIADLSRKSAAVSSTPWAWRSLKGVGKMIARVYTDMLDMQIKRQKLFMARKR